MTNPNEPSQPPAQPSKQTPAQPPAPANEPAAYPPEAPPLDVLIGRIIDGEATLVQRQRFEAMAADDPALWRMLALRQQDMSMLAAHVEPQLNAAEKIELPVGAIDQIESSAGGAGSRRLRVPWWIAISGWAAMIALAVVWSFSDQWLRPGDDMPGGMQASHEPEVLTPDEHLREYKQAPFVLNEMPPTLLQIDQLRDGRLAVSYLRRIVEVAYFDSPEEIPLNADGNLPDSPEVLRQHAPPASQPRD
jgi:hypothetical protein